MSGNMTHYSDWSHLIETSDCDGSKEKEAASLIAAGMKESNRSGIFL